MTITEHTEDTNYYRIVLSDGSIWNVGKWSMQNPNGAINYEAACAVVLLNCPELEA